MRQVTTTTTHYTFQELTSEYDYLMSDDQVKESIINNEVEFLIDGTLV